MGARPDTHQSDATKLVSERELFNTRAFAALIRCSPIEAFPFSFLTEAVLRSLDLREKSETEQIFI